MLLLLSRLSDRALQLLMLTEDISDETVIQSRSQESDGSRIPIKQLFFENYNSPVIELLADFSLSGL